VREAFKVYAGPLEAAVRHYYCTAVMAEALGQVWMVYYDQDRAESFR
jgi:hypothetical protein